MTDMIERMARGIADSQSLAAGEFDRGSSADREHWMEEARAALEAMRTPTEAMIDAATMVRDPRGRTDQNNIATWQAMITAAISEHAVKE